MRLLTTPLLWIAIVFVAGLAAMPLDGFWVNDNGLKYIQTLAIETNEVGDFSLPWPGREMDPRFEFSPLSWGFGPIYQGELHASYSPIFALLSTGPHRLFGFAGLYLWPFLGTLVSLLGTRELARLLCEGNGRARRTGEVAMLVAAFATPVLFYTFTFWEHTPALAFSTWGFVVCARYRLAPSKERAATMALLAACACYLRPDSYLTAFVLGLLCLWPGGRSWRNAGVFAAAFLCAMLPLWGFHWLTVGHPLGPHISSQGWEQQDLANFMAGRLIATRNILLNTHQNPWLSIAIAFPFLALLMTGARRSERPPWLANAALGAAIIGGGIALAGHLSSERPVLGLRSTNGLFAVSPILILALLPTTRAEHWTDEARSVRSTLLAGLVLNAGLYCALVPSLNSGGVHWGCRFLLVAYPMLSALAARNILDLWSEGALGALGGRATRTLIATALALSLASQIYSVTLLHARKAFSSQLADTVGDTPGDLIATNLTHIPLDLARIFYDRPIFLLSSEPQLGELLSRARAAGAGSALIVTAGHDGAPSPGARIVSDGWLRFSPVRLRVVQLSAENSPAPEP